MAFGVLNFVARGSTFALWDADCDPRHGNQHPTRQMRVLFDCHALVGSIASQLAEKGFYQPPTKSIKVNLVMKDVYKLFAKYLKKLYQSNNTIVIVSPTLHFHIVSPSLFHV